MVNFISSPETLQLWASYSLDERCLYFHRHFGRRLKAHTLRRVMKEAGIMQKKVRVVNIPARKTGRVYEFEEKTLELFHKMESHLANKDHIVFLDECVFKARGFKMQAWAAPG